MTDRRPAHLILLALVALLALAGAPWADQVACGSMAFHGRTGGDVLASLSFFDVLRQNDAAPWLLVVWAVLAGITAFGIQRRWAIASRAVLAFTAALAFGLFGVSTWQYLSSMCLFAESAYDMRYGLSLILLLGAAQTGVTLVAAFSRPRRSAH